MNLTEGDKKTDNLERKIQSSYVSHSLGSRIAQFDWHILSRIDCNWPPGKNFACTAGKTLGKKGERKFCSSWKSLPVMYMIEHDARARLGTWVHYDRLQLWRAWKSVYAFTKGFNTLAFLCILPHFLETSTVMFDWLLLLLCELLAGICSDCCNFWQCGVGREKISHSCCQRNYIGAA